jgi:hypothetical protein
VETEAVRAAAAATNKSSIVNVVASLASITARATQHALLEERSRIPFDAAALIADRREALLSQLSQLDEERDRYVQQKTAELDAKQETALQFFAF